MVLVYILFLARRITIILLWKFKRDPHKQEMNLNALAVCTLGIFEAGWAIYFNTFVWKYLDFRFKNANEEDHIFKDLIMIPILCIGFFNIFKNSLIILIFVLLVLGGWITGYWVFDKSRAK